MGVARKYKIKDIRTGEYIPGAYRAGQVQEICGLKYDVSNYASKGNVWGGRWKIEYADDSEIIEKKQLEGWQSIWCAEWEKARKKLLKAGGLL